MLQAPPTQQCPHCKIERPATAEWWPLKKGKLRSDICVPCNRARFKAYESDRKTRTAPKTLPAGTPPDPRRPAAPDPAPKLPAVPRPKKVSIGAAIDTAADYINKNAGVVWERIVHYVNSPESPHHEWAIREFLSRAAPVRAMTGVGERDADVGESAKPAQPPVTIVIQGTPRIEAARVVGSGSAAPDAVPSLDDLT